MSDRERLGEEVRRGASVSPDAYRRTMDIVRRRERRRRVGAGITGLVLVAGLVAGLWSVAASRTPSAGPAAGPSASATPSPSAPPGPTAMITSLGAAAPSEVWVTTVTGMQVSADGGASWQTLAPPAPGVAPDCGATGSAGAFLLDPAHAWVAEAQGTGCSRVEIAWTADGGVTWQTSVVPTQYPNGFGNVHLSFVDPRDGWMTVQTPAGGAAGAQADLYATTDGGASWTSLGSGPFAGPIEFVGPQTGWALEGVYPERLALTHDGGASWQPSSLPVPAADAGDLVLPVSLPTFFGPGVGVMAAGLAAYGTPVEDVAFYTTADGGATWAVAGTLHDPSFQNTGMPGVAFATPQDWVVVAPTGTVYLTADGGATWSSAAANPALAGFPRVAFVSPKVGWALVETHWCTGFKTGCGSASRVLKTTDGGQTWSPDQPPSG